MMLWLVYTNVKEFGGIIDCLYEIIGEFTMRKKYKGIIFGVLSICLTKLGIDEIS